MLHTRFFLALTTTVLLTAGARAQILKAPWVDESQKSIEEIRKVDLRIIVIDKDGNPVPQCPVHIEQTRHAFVLGLRLPKAPPQSAPSKDVIGDAPLWRIFNAASLDAATAWPVTQPSADKWDFSAAEKLLEFTDERGWSSRWGSVVSSDPGRMPAWAAGLSGDELRRAVEAHAKKVFEKYSRRFEQFDVVTNLLDHRHLERELGFAGIRRLYTIAENQGPGLAKSSPIGRSSLAFTDAFAPARLQHVMQHVTAMREGFVPVDALAIEVRLNGSLVEAPITRSLKTMGDPGLPVIVTNLEIAGSSESGATINVETAMRAMFANPALHGIFWAGLRADELHDEEAALVDEDGPTEAGELLDRVWRQLWWTDVTAATDDLGNVRQRVFAGHYKLTAVLPDGTIADAEVFLPANNPRLVLLQPVKPAPVPVVKKVPAKEPASQDEDSIIHSAAGRTILSEPRATPAKPPAPVGKARLEFDVRP